METRRLRKRVRGLPAERSPEWLPEGWTVEVRNTRHGKYMYYRSQASGCTFQSKEELLRYLKAVKLASGTSGRASVSNESKKQVFGRPTFYVNKSFKATLSNLIYHWRACTTHPFLRTRLQQICAASFGWTPEKTDEYIIPKIAERDLRRFANLRNSSSELGAKIPLQKMPVPCPVTAIVKQRKLKGRDCFEVSWREMDGLQTSVVSADLIESACPEKIAEFVERKTITKKRNSRKQKANMDSNVDLTKVDLRLQNLILDIEKSQQSSSFSLPSSSQLLPSPLIQHIGPAIIDLSSPSPPLKSHKLARSHEIINREIKTIDLCDADAEVLSLEHERKARELRLFIESIREDL